MNLDKPSSGAIGTSATLLSLFARSDANDSPEKSAIKCVGDKALPQILQDFDVVAILRYYAYVFCARARCVLIEKVERGRPVMS